MTVILTSSPTMDSFEIPPVPALFPDNQFIAQLQQRWTPQARCLMIAAFPDAHGLNDGMTDYYRAAVENSGLAVEYFAIWDDRWEGPDREWFHKCDAIFLAGGHIATQMAWFERIGLKDLLEGYRGLVIGTSAGSMNSAREVYSWPEEPGESFRSVEELFYPGLGLADTLILPHYQKVREKMLDGRRAMEDITYPHSVGRRFYAIPDGSFVLVDEGEETMFGEAWVISDGDISPFSCEGQTRIIK